jgi:hypothetical protein
MEWLNRMTICLCQPLAHRMHCHYIVKCRQRHRLHLLRSSSICCSFAVLFVPCCRYHLHPPCSSRLFQLPMKLTHNYDDSCIPRLSRETTNKSVKHLCWQSPQQDSNAFQGPHLLAAMMAKTWLTQSLC